MRKVLVPLIAGVVASWSSAAVVSVSGDVQVIAAPPSVASGALQTPETAVVFQERTGVQFNGVVDFVNPPVGPMLNITDVNNFGISEVVDSHMFHFDVTGVNVSTNLVGTITFDQPVYAVIIKNDKLDNTDQVLGAPGTVYPAGVASRGYTNSSDWFRMLTPTTLQFNVSNINTADQIRVLTRSVPAPGSAAWLGLGVLAGVRRRR